MDQCSQLHFATTSSPSRHIGVWTYPDNQSIVYGSDNLDESPAINWLTHHPQPPARKGQDYVAGLRLIDLRNSSYRTFPLEKSMFDHLLEELASPVLKLHGSAFRIGGCESYVVGPSQRPNIGKMKDFFTLTYYARASEKLEFSTYLFSSRYPKCCARCS